MKREELILESERFTTISALAREVEALLTHSDYKLIVQVKATELEELSNLCENFRTLGRVRIERAE